MKFKVLASSSLGNCYLLQGEKETLILECGVNYKTILRGLNFNLNSACGCLVTHEHKDHSKAITDLVKNGIYVYTSEGTIQALNLPLKHRLFPISSEKQIRFDGFTILPFESQHDAAEPLGFLIQHPELGKMIFATDTYYIQYKFKGLNHIVIECNYSEQIIKQRIELGQLNPILASRLIKSHFSLENVKEFLNANDLSQVRDITLIHLSDSNSDAALFKDGIQKLTGKPVYIADPGLELEFGGALFAKE